jgi:tRNA (cytidine/uridine-2'-O-)-methyltransferase
MHIFFYNKGPAALYRCIISAEGISKLGNETQSFAENLLYNNPDKCVRLPMRESLRSLNLSNTVAVAVYEVLRQRDFHSLISSGELTEFKW